MPPVIWPCSFPAGCGVGVVWTPSCRHAETILHLRSGQYLQDRERAWERFLPPHTGEFDQRTLVKRANALCSPCDRPLLSRELPTVWWTFFVCLFLYFLIFSHPKIKPAPPITDCYRARGQWRWVTHALCISISTPFLDLWIPKLLLLLLVLLVHTLEQEINLMSIMKLTNLN